MCARDVQQQHDACVQALVPSQASMHAKQTGVERRLHALRIRGRVAHCNPYEVLSYCMAPRVKDLRVGPASKL